MASDQSNKDDGDEIQIQTTERQLSKNNITGGRNCNSGFLPSCRNSNACHLLYISIPCFSRTAKIKVKNIYEDTKQVYTSF